MAFGQRGAEVTSTKISARRFWKKFLTGIRLFPFILFASFCCSRLSSVSPGTLTSYASPMDKVSGNDSYSSSNFSKRIHSTDSLATTTNTCKLTFYACPQLFRTSIQFFVVYNNIYSSSPFEFQAFNNDIAFGNERLPLFNATRVFDVTCVFIRYSDNSGWFLCWKLIQRAEKKTGINRKLLTINMTTWSDHKYWPFSYFRWAFHEKKIYL